MVNRTALAALLLTISSPAFAGDAALRQAQGLVNGNAASYDGGCTGGSCGAQVTACEGESCKINRSSAGALQTGGLVVAETKPRAAMTAVVPTPTLNEGNKNSKDKPGFFKGLFSGKGLMYGLGGAAAGAGVGFLLGGPIGAVIGGLLGAVAGFFLSKLLAK